MSKREENVGPAGVLKRLRDELDSAQNDIDDKHLQDLIRKTIVRIDNLLNQLPMSNENNDD